METWIIAGVIIAAMIAVIVVKIYNKSRGKGGCSGCSGCPSAGACHPERKESDNKKV